MDVKTKTMGVKSVEENHIVTFPEGLFGFEDYKKYATIESQWAPLIWLQSLDDERLAFLLIDPFLICGDYEADIEDLIVMAVVTVPSDGSAVSANLQGPIVINKKNNLCVQVILSDSRWTTKHAIIDALKKRGGK